MGQKRKFWEVVLDVFDREIDLYTDYLWNDILRCRVTGFIKTKPPSLHRFVRHSLFWWSIAIHFPPTFIILFSFVFAHMNAPMWVIHVRFETHWLREPPPPTVGTHTAPMSCIALQRPCVLCTILYLLLSRFVRRCGDDHLELEAHIIVPHLLFACLWACGGFWEGKERFRAVWRGAN